MRSGLALLLLATPAFADSFGGFSGVDRPYLVSPDRVCAPLEVKDKVAAGMPSCTKGTTEGIAHLDVKEPARGELKATASGTKLTVTNKAGDTLVTWTAPDPIGKVTDVFVSKYEDRVAVVYTTRRLGKEVTAVVAFELVKTTGRSEPVKPVEQTPTTQPVTQAPPADPKLTKALDSARKVKTKAAWQAVLAVDADNSEAHYRLAALAGKAGTPELQTLAKSKRPDAIEWLVEARFDPAFAALRVDKAFRDATGLDRAPATMYEHVMGFGGQWEQTGTSCDKAEVHLTLQRDRSFRLRVKTNCEGQGFDLPFKGTWQVASDNKGIVLTLPPAKGKAATGKDMAPCDLAKAGEEDSLHCDLGNDLDFTVLPTRR